MQKKIQNPAEKGKETQIDALGLLLVETKWTRKPRPRDLRVDFKADYRILQRVDAVLVHELYNGDKTVSAVSNTVFLEIYDTYRKRLRLTKITRQIALLAHRGIVVDVVSDVCWDVQRVVALTPEWRTRVQQVLEKTPEKYTAPPPNAVKARCTHCGKTSYVMPFSISCPVCSKHLPTLQHTS